MAIGGECFWIRSPSEFERAIYMAGFNKTNFAGRVGISYSALWKQLSWRSSVKPGTAMRAARILDKEISDLYTMLPAGMRMTR